MSDVGSVVWCDTAIWGVSAGLLDVTLLVGLPDVGLILFCNWIALVDCDFLLICRFDLYSYSCRVVLYSVFLYYRIYRRVVLWQPLGRYIVITCTSFVCMWAGSHTKKVDWLNIKYIFICFSLQWFFWSSTAVQQYLTILILELQQSNLILDTTAIYSNTWYFSSQT